jgi:predicted nucleic acid-binding protein
MSTSIDTNVVTALWQPDDALNKIAKSAMDQEMMRGNLVISAPVYAELCAAPGRNEAFVDYFLRDSAISVEWDIDEQIWRTAARAFHRYAAVRRKQAAAGPRRILADFLIGAHALRRGYRLLTLDSGIYRSSFPRLTVVHA